MQLETKVQITKDDCQQPSKPYTTPTLTDYGAVEDQTRSGQDIGVDHFHSS